MPDPRDPHAAERLAERNRQYRESLADYHATTPVTDESHLTATAIAACGRCDDDGYRPNRTVCDHTDRTNVGQQQREQIRQLLAKGKP